jgi:RNA polymerase sigma factor (sigma-70 family)
MATSPMSKVVQQLRRTALVRDDGGQTDGQLLECFIARRDEDAFEALVRRHGPMVLGVCRRVVGSVHDAEDAFQATFLVLVRKAASLGSRERVGNWLYGVAYRTALKARVATVRRRLKEKQVQHMPQPKVEPEEGGSDWQPLLDQELNRLPAKYRVPLVLCELEGRTRKEVARQLHLPEGTLSSRLATARTLLAKRLARRGLALSGGALAVVLAEQAASAGLPAALVVSTVKAASLGAGAALTAGVVSAEVAALTEGVLKAMLLTKLKIATVVLLTVGALGIGAGVFTRPAQVNGQAPAQGPAPDERLKQAEDSVQAAQARAAEAKANVQAAEAQLRLAEAQLKAAQEVAQQASLRQQLQALAWVLQSVQAKTNTIALLSGSPGDGMGDSLFLEGVPVAKSATIVIDGKAGQFADLKGGMHLSLRLAADKLTVTKIDATSAKQIDYIIKAIDAKRHTISVTVRGKNLTLDDLHVDLDAEARIDGRSVELAELKVGMHVSLRMEVEGDRIVVTELRVRQ